MNTYISAQNVEHTPEGLLAEARASLPTGNDGHARAVAGKPLVVHVHAWDRWAVGGKGARRVSLRVAGQYVDRAVFLAASTTDAERFAGELRALVGAQS